MTKLLQHKNYLDDWNREGILILKDILTLEEIEVYLKAIDETLEASNYNLSNCKFEDTSHAHGKEYFNILNVIKYTDKLDRLLDHPKIFDIVTYILGPYIQVMSMDLFVRHPNNKLNDLGRFHTDGGPSLQKILPTNRNLPIQFKVQFFLTDMKDENMSNFVYIPRTHKKMVKYNHIFCYIPQCNKYVEKGMMPPDAIQVKIEAGDVIIHPYSLWHAVAPNHSTVTRKSISVRYGQMWLKPYYDKLEKSLLNRLTERQRRLLGDYGESNRADAPYRPSSDHVKIITGIDNKE